MYYIITQIWLFWQVIEQIQIELYNLEGGQQESAYKEYDKFKIKQDKLYKSDFDNFLNEARMIENGSDK